MNTLWYKTPAEDWNQALPVGNGRIGAMVFGNPGREVIQLNEESVWSGPYKNRNNPDSLKNIKEIQSLVAKGKVAEAQKLAYQSMTATPVCGAAYQSAGELRIDFHSKEDAAIETVNPVSFNAFKNISCYRRELDLETAICTTSFTADSSTPSTADFSPDSEGSSVSYTREVFVSAPANVLVIHIAASVPKSIYFSAYLDRGIWADKNFAVSDDTICLEDTHGIPFCVMATAQASGGNVFTRGANIIVEGADEVTIYVDIQTAYRIRRYNRKKGRVNGKYRGLLSKCFNTALHNICFAMGAPYDINKETHVEEYSHYYNKAKLELVPQDAPEQNFSTDELLKDKKSNALAELYWNYSRYLLLSSSREPGTLPANLQGIWCKDIESAWGCGYTININTQMNYWPANMCSLSKTELPLFNLMEFLYQNGAVTANTMYGSDGWVAHHNTDIWGDSAPKDEWLPGTYWLLGAAWLSTHVREHFEYTLDYSFLRKNYYLMHGACRFFASFLIPSEDGKYLVLSPSVSPENTYIDKDGKVVSMCAGCEMDNRILEHLFDATLKSAENLNFNLKKGELKKFAEIKDKLKPTVVSKENTILEWTEEREEIEPGHRHISHLYGLFPGHSISVEKTPELAEAARNSINKRLANGGGHTGWSQAWIMNFWTSLRDSKNAYDSLTSLFEKSTLPNLFDNHPPFQIDGNFGALTAMTLMIVKSEWADSQIEIHLLPALPEAWQNGKLTGISLKGNLLLDIEWKNCQIEGARIYSKTGRAFAEDIVVCYQGKKYSAHIVEGNIDVMNLLPTTV